MILLFCTFWLGLVYFDFPIWNIISCQAWHELYGQLKERSDKIYIVYACIVLLLSLNAYLILFPSIYINVPLQT
jgi:hypothetical protein